MNIYFLFQYEPSKLTNIFKRKKVPCKGSSKIFLSGAVRLPIAHLTNVTLPSNASYIMLTFAVITWYDDYRNNYEYCFCQKSHYPDVWKNWMKTVLFSVFLTFFNDQHIQLTGRIDAFSVVNTSRVPSVSAKS